VRPACHHHLQRAARADQARQALRAAIARDQAELHFGQTELGVRQRQSERACQSQLAAAAECKAVDERDRGQGEPIEQAEHGLSKLSAGALGGQATVLKFLDVGAGTEGLLAFAGHDECACR
jgi:hypothetical protein